MDLGFASPALIFPAPTQTYRLKPFQINTPQPKTQTNKTYKIGGKKCKTQTNIKTLLYRIPNSNKLKHREKNPRSSGRRSGTQTKPYKTKVKDTNTTTQKLNPRHEIVRNPHMKKTEVKNGENSPVTRT